MSDPAIRRSLILVCDHTGRIKRQVGGKSGRLSSNHISILFEKSQANRALEFFKSILELGEAQQSKFDLRFGEKVETMLVTGFTAGDAVVLIASNEMTLPPDLLDDMSQIGNEQMNLLRQVHQQLGARLRSEEAPENSVFSDLMDLNNDLVTLQRELTRKNVELKTLNHQKNQFLGMAAHDLRNPLAIIQKYSEFLIEEASEALEAEHVEFLKTIQSSSQYMFGLVNEWLDISKIEAGRLDLNCQQTDIAELCEKCLRMNRHFAEQKSMQFDVRIDESLPALLLDAQKMNQVLNNLISNAIKYSMPGSLISLQAEQDEKYVKIVVEDEGQGIPADELDSLFQAYQTTSVKSTGGERSTGLGLAIVKRIIEGHAGKIHAESEVGKGSRFIILLPITDALSPMLPDAQKAKPAAESGAIQGKSILVVDDDAINRNLARRILERAGATVALAEDGDRALASLQQNRFDFVLMDVEMPVRDGVATTRSLRQSERRALAEMPIIAMTAHQDPVRQAELLAAGMNACLAKPLDLQALSDTLRNLPGGAAVN